MKYHVKNTIEYFGDKPYSIDPISEGNTHLFDMSELTSQDIDKLIEEYIEDKDINNLEEEVGNICGGLVIIRNSEILLTPKCCGDLSNIYSWDEIGSKASKQWKQIWIGHPWVYFRKKGDVTEISEYYDDDPKTKRVSFSIPQSVLSDLLKNARLVQTEFQRKLCLRLKLKNIKNPEIIAERLGCSLRNQIIIHQAYLSSGNSGKLTN